MVTGDITQIDLADSHRSGLVEATKVLKNIDDVAVITLNERTLFGISIVQSIIKAYDRYNQSRKSR